ncbi:hypothetical protein M3484_14520 [Pseudomonas sp. GX19020]|uniref:hypothetical protein n=1 Tax=Pseudomonas sp. GX19020 TaxID=2942277 RepID=UPI0020190669|nr:hypothetical protein [Pseudomonas sp. GX19020]MCL4067787.1 hypothetical protein [Pseudomonas sp. GX19020]
MIESPKEITIPVLRADVEQGAKRMRPACCLSKQARPHRWSALKDGARLAVIFGLAIPLSAFSVGAQTADLVKNSMVHKVAADSMTTTTSVYCTIAGRTDGDAGRIVCSELLALLQTTHPQYGFTLAAGASAPPALEIRILLATDNNLSLVLSLTGADGTRLETENFSVSAMDRKLTPQLRNNVYRRAIADIVPAG